MTEKRTRMAQDGRTARGCSRGRVWRRSSILGQSGAFYSVMVVAHA